MTGGEERDREIVGSGTVEERLGLAREVSGELDIRISGGANVIVQYLNAGLVAESAIDLAPVVFGSGTPLLGGLDIDRIEIELAEAIHSPLVTHLRYYLHRKDRRDGRRAGADPLVSVPRAW